MDVNTYYKSESNYLKADEFEVGKSYKLTIKDTEEVIFDGKNGNPDTHKLALTFNETEKKLTLNKTNATTISSLYGSESDTWPGKVILLFRTKVSFGDDMVDAIRVDLPRQEAAIPIAPPHPTAAELDAMPHDDVPF
jgi:hypothetical protein|tara:strand:- start:7708 stop:8118 length:411 start_codon:yes stop_codon:yes gene_type:complete